jgi:hypothetical protein
VISEYEADFPTNLTAASKPVSITVAFGWGEIGGYTGGPGATAVTSGAVGGFATAGSYTLGQVTTMYNNAAAGFQSPNSALVTANAHIPSTYPNPGGGTSFLLGDAEFKALNNGTAQNLDAVDGDTGYATNICSGNTCSGFLMPAIEHEIAHAMGRIDFAFAAGAGNAPSELTPLDFFKYTISGGGGCTNTLDPKFDQTCFSIDGGATNPLGRQFSNVSDSADWNSTTSDSYNWSIGDGATVSSADITEMCALGWQGCGSPVVPAPPIGHGLPIFMAVGALLFGAKLRERNKNKSVVGLGPRGWLSLGT